MSKNSDYFPVTEKLGQDMVGRAIHESVRIGFGSDPNSTRFNRVTKFWTHILPNIRVRPNILGHQLGGSELSVTRLGFQTINLWVYFILTGDFHNK